MRLQDTGINSLNARFGTWLLDLGSGKLQSDVTSDIEIKHCKTNTFPPTTTFSPISVLESYTGLNNLLQRQDWNALTEYYAERFIITTLNATVDSINTFMMTNLSGELYTSTSIDLTDENFANPVTPDILNGFDFPGFPRHKLDLKVGAVVILIRNLSLDNGLCNGTRMVITAYARNALECRIVTGEKKGTVVLIPKIKLHHEGSGKFPIPFFRHQFPVAPAFCLTINKS